MSGNTHVTTLRLTPELADEVDFVARVDGITTSEFIREAIAARIADRRADPRFRERLRARTEADQCIASRLVPP